MTPETLSQCMPFAGVRVNEFAEPITVAMSEFHIDTPKRQAAFLAQVCHETGSLKYMEEIASGSAYEGRADLGNSQPGDGVKYKGRGLIQITGRANYLRCGMALGYDLLANPYLLIQPLAACRSAGWFWRENQLNELADGDKFGSMTRRINGGFNHIDERIIHWLRIRKVLGL